MNTIRVGTVAQKTGVSVNTIWRWSREMQDFPKPIKLSPGVTAWSEAAIDNWLKAKQGESIESQ